MIDLSPDFHQLTLKERAVTSELLSPIMRHFSTLWYLLDFCRSKCYLAHHASFTCIANFGATFSDLYRWQRYPALFVNTIWKTCTWFRKNFVKQILPLVGKSSSLPFRLVEFWALLTQPRTFQRTRTDFSCQKCSSYSDTEGFTTFYRFSKFLPCVHQRFCKNSSTFDCAWCRVCDQRHRKISMAWEL